MTRAASAWLTVRSLVWTLLFPGVVTGYLPWRFFGLNQIHVDLRSPAGIFGLLVIALGATLLGACIVEFARSGRGTLAPMDLRVAGAVSATLGLRRCLVCRGQPVRDRL